MKLLTAVLILAAFAAVAAACGDDDTDQPGSDDPNGPAAEVEGVWDGSYESGQSGSTGIFCLDLEQAGRTLSGTLTFQGEDAVEIGGLIANNDIGITLGPGATSDGGTTGLTSGGNLSGGVDGESMSGTWASTDDDTGDWSATLTDADSCDVPS